MRSRRVEGFDEEGVVAKALATARNTKRGTRYIVQAKEKEDSDYADRVLISATDDPKKIDVQIRHFDTDVIAQLNKEGQFAGARGSVDLAEGITKAIVSKARIDVGTKSRAILLLQIPSAIGQMARKQLQRMSFDLKGFKEVWVSPFREEPFELFPPIPEDWIAVAACYLWDKAARPWGDDQKFWFAAIDEIRGL